MSISDVVSGMSPEEAIRQSKIREISNNEFETFFNQDHKIEKLIGLALAKSFDEILAKFKEYKYQITYREELLNKDEETKRKLFIKTNKKIVGKLTTKLTSIAQYDQMPDIIDLRNVLEEVILKQANHEGEISNLKSKIKTLPRKRKSNKFINLLYLAILLVLIGFTVLIIYKGWAEQTTVSIEYNIGEIIAGLLAGTGVAIAGTAYASKIINDIKDDSGPDNPKG